MPNWWGNMSGAQMVEMGMNIFDMAQKRAMLQQEQQRQQQQQEIENLFNRQEIDLSRQQLDLQKEKQDLELEFEKKERGWKEKEQQRQQEKWNKINEYSQGLSEMIPELDFSDPENMKKLYAFQAKYQPYGVTPKYIEPEIPESAKEMTQEEYSNLVFRTWDKLKDYVENKYKADAKNYENLGFFAKRQRNERGELISPEPELTLPTIDDAKRLVDDMLARGVNIDDVLKPKLQPMPMPQPQAVGPQYRLGAQTMPYGQMGLGQKAKLAIQPFMEMFNSSKRQYNALPPNEKTIVNRYIKDLKLSMPEALDWLKQAKAMKAQ